MKKTIFTLMTTTVLLGCTCTDNPFFAEYNTPYGVPPFDKIKTEHYLPAFKKGIEQQQTEIDAITANTEEPTFDNTIAALDFSGVILSRVSNVFFNLETSDSNDEMQKISEEVSPLLSEHGDNIYLNAKLFARVKTLYDQREILNLTLEQSRLLEKYYKSFVRSGALLDEMQQAELRELNKELALADLQYGNNVLAQINSYKRFVENESELSGLPESVKQAAKEAAKAANEPNKWLFSTQKSSFLPVLQYADNRDLRRDLLTAYNNLANNNDSNDNKALVQKLVKLRVKKSQLLGYKTFADFSLENTMAKNSQAVYDFMKTVWQPALAAAKKEREKLQILMNEEFKGETLQAWDWSYYAEKLRKQKYALDEEAVRTYFKMENVRQGAFDLATKLYGLQFTKVNNLPLYNAEAETFEVKDADGALLGILYTDYFPRAGKRAGAWMTNFTEQYTKDGVNHRPVIANVGNFTRPTESTPSLLTMDEVETVFHEFGHALHGLLSQCNYISTSGTNVSRDFVELPSQVMENWCFEPEMLKLYARHWQTNEIIPNEYIEKIAAAAKFNQGFAMTELLSAAYLDMDYHTVTDTANFDVAAFEKTALDKIGLIPEIVVRYRSTYFNHVFGGGYSAGYYSYVWAEVLDADAFEAFKESGDIFNKEIATAFRKNILEKGNAEDPMTLYQNFRKATPNPKALLKRRGFE